MSMGYDPYAEIDASGLGNLDTGMSGNVNMPEQNIQTGVANIQTDPYDYGFSFVGSGLGATSPNHAFNLQEGVGEGGSESATPWMQGGGYQGMPQYASFFDPATGQLREGYQQDVLSARPESAWLGMELDKQRLGEQNLMNQAAMQSQMGRANVLGNMAMRGGMDSGAGRLQLRDSERQRMGGQMAVARQGALQRAGMRLGDMQRQVQAEDVNRLRAMGRGDTEYGRARDQWEREREIKAQEELADLIGDQKDLSTLEWMGLGFLEPIGEKFSGMKDWQMGGLTGKAWMDLRDAVGNWTAGVKGLT